MQVGEIMTRSVTLVSPDAPIKEAAIRMRDGNFGALPVAANNTLVGMVTDRDIAMRAVADDRTPDAALVRDVMSEHIFYCFDDDAVATAARTMAEHQVHRLPVLNRDDRLVGIVALADLARVSGEATDEAICGISEPTNVPRR
jgi:CBS domain-containing protein